MYGRHSMQDQRMALHPEPPLRRSLQVIPGAISGEMSVSEIPALCAAPGVRTVTNEERGRNNQIRVFQELRQSLDLVGRPSIQLQRHVSLDRVRRTIEAKEVPRLAKRQAEKEKPVLEAAGQLDITEHMESVPATLGLLGSSEQGLSAADAQKRLASDGPNLLTPPKPIPIWIQFGRHLLAPFSILLIVAGLLSIGLYFLKPSVKDNIILSAVLLVAAFLNAFIEFYQERKSMAIIAGFAGFIPENALVIRDGVSSRTAASSLVAGDLVSVKAGDKVPADLRVMTLDPSSGCKVDNSMLTGESEPVELQLNASHQNPLETKNLMFSGTIVASGQATGIVIRTGDRTVMGQIAKVTNSEKKVRSRLGIELTYFLKVVGTVAAIVFAAVIAIGAARGLSWLEFIIYAIGVVVGFVPQGLLTTVTMILSNSGRRLLKINVLAKDLEAIETLGSITILATDKTGTLTMNQMTVVRLYAGGQEYSVGGSTAGSATTATTVSPAPEAPEDGSSAIAAAAPPKEMLPAFDGRMPVFAQITAFSAVCSRASFERTPENLSKPIEKRVVLGDATEAGLLRFAAFESGDHVDEILADYRRLFEIPFNSERKWYAGVFRQISTSKLLVIMKGAPERVFVRCGRKVDRSGAVADFDPTRKEAETASFMTEYESLASNGLRVLAFAFCELDEAVYGAEGFTFASEPVPNFPLDNMVFLCLTGLLDPPKPGVKEAVATCRAAHIRLMMVTGDHPLTAQAIAKDVGIIQTEDHVVVTGEQMEKMSDGDWANLFRKHEVVFARTSPQNKLEIVVRAQSFGHIIAMTGDGVNDSAALKRANLGIAMAISGSDVSKEAAQVILLDDNFASIVKGIEQGRIIFDNVKRAVRYITAHTFPEVIPFLLYFIFLIPLPLAPLLLLFTDLGTELAPGIHFAFEPGEGDVMLLYPRYPFVPPPADLSSNASVVRPGPSDEKALHLGRTGAVAAPEPLVSDAGACGAPASAPGDAGHRLVTSTFVAPAGWTVPPGQSVPIVAEATIGECHVINVPDPSHKIAAGLGTAATPQHTMLQRLRHRLLRKHHHHQQQQQQPSSSLAERLVDKHLLISSWLQIGLIETAGCLFTYFGVFLRAGLPPSELNGIARSYFNEDPSGTYISHNGTVFSTTDQIQLLHEAESAYWVALVMQQVAVMFITKARRRPLTLHRALQNKKSFVAVAIAFTIAGLIIYVPPFHSVFNTSNVRAFAYWMPIPFFLLIFIYDYVVKKTFLFKYLHW